MAVAGALVGIATWLAATHLIGWMGGDPEGGVQGEIAKYQGMAAMEQQMPMDRMRQRLAASEEMEGATGREMSRFGSEAREVAMGRRVTSSRELLESVSAQLGTTPEDLGRRLSPTRMGDYSSLSKAAFGRSAKQMGPQNG